MKFAPRFVMMAIDIIIGALLAVRAITMFNRTTDTASDQQNALASLQSEYQNRDILLLDGETIPAPKVISLARQHNKSMGIYKNGVMLQPGVTINSELFKDNTHWLVEVRVNENGAAYAINFKDISLTQSDPATVSEAKSTIASLLGENASTGWGDLYARIGDLMQADVYRALLCELTGINRNSLWPETFESVDKALSTYEGSVVHASEMFTVPVNGTAKWKMDGPTFAFIRSAEKVGLVIFGASGYRVIGDFEDSNILIDETSKSFTTDNVNDITSVILIRQ